MQDAGTAAAGITILLIFLGIAAFWCALPGIICGYILKSSGRNFWWGFVLGMVFGPLGLLVCIIFAIVGRPQQSQAITYAPPPSRPEQRYADNDYSDSIPPRANNSVPWAIAGLASFVCILAIGALGVMLYRRSDAPPSAIPTALAIPSPTPATLQQNILPASATPTPYVPPSATPTPEQTETEELAAAEAPTATPTPTVTPTPTPAATPKPSPSPTPAPSPSPTAQAAGATLAPVAKP